MEKRQNRGIEKEKFLTKGIDGRAEELLNARKKDEINTAKLQKTGKTQIVMSVAGSDNEIMALDERDSEIFVSALLQPALPSGRLKKAIARYKKIMD